MPFHQFNATRICRTQPIFVDDGGEPLKPFLPTFFGYILVDALPQRPWMGWLVEALGLLLQHLTVYGTCHSLTFNMGNPRSGDVETKKLTKTLNYFI